MALSLEQIIAAFAAGTLILIALGIGVQSQQETAGETVTYGDRARTLALTQGLDRDLRNLGALRPAGDRPIRSWSTREGVTRADFLTTDASGVSVRVRYEATPAGKVQRADGDSVKVYEVRRREGTGPPSTLGPQVTRFELTPLDAAGTPVGPPYDGVAAVSVVLETRPAPGPLEVRIDSHAVRTPNTNL